MTKRKSPAPIRNALRAEFYESVVEVLRTARRTAHRAVNFTMVEAYWDVGRAKKVEFLPQDGCTFHLNVLSKRGVTFTIHSRSSK